MKIGIDGRFFAISITGIGRYIYELSRSLDSVMPSAEFYVYSPWPTRVSLPSSRWHLRIDRRFAGTRYSRTVMFLWPVLRPAVLSSRDMVDVFWAGQAPFIPRMPKRTKVVATVHDLHYIVSPETMRPVTRQMFRLLESRYKYAAAIATNSSGTMLRLSQALGRRAAAVVRPAVSGDFRPAGSGRIETVRRRYNLAPQYVLAVATWDPRKNLRALIRAFVEMKHAGEARGCILAIAGHPPPLLSKLRDTAGLLANAASRGDIRFLGYVPDSDLPALYSGAAVFVCPSFYEGFGIPLAEARACGAAIVATDIPELREAGGESAIYVRPEASALRQGINAALWRPPMVTAPGWTWEEGACALRDIFSECAGNGRSGGVS